MTFFIGGVNFIFWRAKAVKRSSREKDRIFHFLKD